MLLRSCCRECFDWMRVNMYGVGTKVALGSIFLVHRCFVDQDLDHLWILTT